jgi:hypothetical protein
VPPTEVPSNPNSAGHGTGNADESDGPSAGCVKNSATSAMKIQATAWRSGAAWPAAAWWLPMSRLQNRRMDNGEVDNRNMDPGMDMMTSDELCGNRIWMSTF